MFVFGDKRHKKFINFIIRFREVKMNKSESRNRMDFMTSATIFWSAKNAKKFQKKDLFTPACGLTILY
jgi:hypothetical protein